MVFVHIVLRVFNLLKGRATSRVQMLAPSPYGMLVTGFAISVILGPRVRYLLLPSSYPSSPYRQHAIFNIVDGVHIFGRFASDMTRKLRTLCSNRPGTKNANPLLTSRISEAAPRSSSIPQAPLAPQAPGFCKLRLARTVSVFRKSFHAPPSSSNYYYSHTFSIPLIIYY